PPPVPLSPLSPEFQKLKELAEAAAARTAREQSEAAEAKAARDEAHINAALLASSDPELSPTDAGAALLYTRGRAFQLLRPAWDTLQTAMEAKDTRPAAKIELALEIIKRAVGNATVPNGIGADLAKMVPSEAIDLVLKHAAEGRISMEFADGLIKTLRSKVKAALHEEEIRKRGGAKTDV
ncbi:hypothetical protein, partial [Rhizobium ruizarguesonis]|uniref:hypothetical protein n=3 Tax=Rhizobium ruizarguesonis TaxID=2081791 RepID=UPI001954FC08